MILGDGIDVTSVRSCPEGSSGKLPFENIGAVIAAVLIGSVSFVVSLQWTNAFNATRDFLDTRRDKRHPVLDSFVSAVVVTMIMLCVVASIVAIQNAIRGYS